MSSIATIISRSRSAVVIIMASIDLSLKYSFGGTRAAPLVSRVIAFAFFPTSSTSLQEALLERTDLLLGDLCAVFDNACETFDTSSHDKTDAAAASKALQEMMGAVTYATKNILAQSPSVKYAVMFTRIQSLFARLEAVQTRLGPHAAQTVTDFMMPIWSVLRTIDASFSPVMNDAGRQGVDEASLTSGALPDTSVC
jgi:hypothetical protein